MSLDSFWGVGPEEAAARVPVTPGRPVTGRVVRLDLDPSLRASWLPPGPLPLWLEQQPAPCPPGAHPLARLQDGSPAIVEADGRVAFLFDPQAAIEAVLEERYFEPRRPLHTRSPVPYHLVPGWLRLRLFRLLAVRGEAARDGFPRWPVDGCVDALRFAYRRALERGGAQVATHWPDGASWAFAVSHDVDTSAGLARVLEVAQAEAALGVRACWFLVGDLLDEEPGLPEQLRELGHEVGLHGDRHDNRLGYATGRELDRRVARCAALAARHRLAGFRAPSLLETPRLRERLRDVFAYTSDVPDCEVDALVAPRRGCGTCFPFRKRSMLELPISLPLEDKLLLAGMDEDGMLALWRRKLHWAREAGGVALLAVHNEPHLLARARGAWERLLAEASQLPSCWQATPGEVARRWS